MPFYWITPTKIFIFFNSLVKKLHLEFKTLLGTSSLIGSSLIFIRVFIFILINNFMGLFPYIFTASSHIALTLTLSLPLWLAFIMYGWVNHTKHIFAHLVPQSTPGALIPFIVLIESIRNVIRPLTLAVRLIANIVAGHLLITLLGNQTAVASNIILISLILTQILLLTLESAVAVIQSYVFAVLSTLYASEITSH
jgi:F-type H+-transporting ATPase subunit a